jgi:outer membrane receptor protein involved in Fe transport
LKGHYYHKEGNVSMKKLLILSLLVLGFSCLSIAGITGKISGKVTDKETGEALPAVNIVVEGTNFGASTNIQGEYFIINVPPGTYNLTARIIGYTSLTIQKVKIAPDLTTEVNFLLSPMVIEVSESVVVIAERPLIQKDLTATVTITDAEQIKKMPINTSQEVLMTTAGFIETRGGADQGIHVRGGRTGEIAYMVDGVLVNDPLFGKVSMDIPVSGIESMSVLVGTFNAEYGQVLSAVVNRVTKVGGQKFTGFLKTATDKIGIDKNDWNTYRIDGNFGGPVPFTGKKLTFYISGNVNNTDTYLGKYTLVQDVDPKINYSGLNQGVTKKDGKYIHYFVTPQKDTLLNPLPPKDKTFDDKYPVGIKYVNGKPQYIYEKSKESEPPVYDNRALIYGKINFYPIDEIKLILGSYYDNQRVKKYRRFFKLIPSHNGHDDIEQFLHTLSLDHAITANTFYNLKLFSYDLKFEHHLHKPKKDIVTSYALTFPFGWNSRYEFAGSYMEEKISPTGDTTYVIKIMDDDYYQKYRSQVYGGNFYLKSQISKEHFVEVGFEYKGYKLNNNEIDGVNNPDAQITNYKVSPNQSAMYVHDKMEFNDMIVNASIRLDYLDPNSTYITNVTNLRNPGLKKAKKKLDISPRLGFAYPITDRAKFHFSYGKHLQYPNFEFFYKRYDQSYQNNTSINPSGIPVDIAKGLSPYIGNPNVKPQTQIAYQFGLETVLSENLTVDFTVFYKDIYDYISTKVEVTAVPASYTRLINEDYGNSKGIEISIKKRFSNYFGGNISYTYSRAEGNATNWEEHFYEYYNSSVYFTAPPKRTTPLDWDQPHTLVFNIDFRFPEDFGINLLGYKFPGSSGVNFLGNFGSGFPFTPTEARGIEIGPKNSQRKPWTGTVDTRLEKYFSIQKINFRIFADITNIFDKENVLSVFTSTGQPNQSANPNASDELQDIPSFYGPRRHVEIGFAVDF